MSAEQDLRKIYDSLDRAGVTANTLQMKYLQAAWQATDSLNRKLQIDKARLKAANEYQQVSLFNE